MAVTGGRVQLRTYHRAMATDLPIERPAAQHLSLPHGALALAGLAATAGFIHLVAMIEHIGVDWTLALFFLLVGSGQLALGWWIYRDGADARLLKLAAVASVGVAMLWVWSRTTGMPFGPEAGGPRKVGVGDTIATLLELGFAALVGVILARGARAVAWLSGPIGVRLTCLVLSLALMMAALGGHQH